MTPGLVIGATRTANREVLAEHTVQRVPGCASLVHTGSCTNVVRVSIAKWGIDPP